MRAEVHQEVARGAELRRAIKVMRELAEAATPGIWEDCAVQVPSGDIYNAIGTDDPEVEVCSLARTPQGSMDAAHIASWHPAAALAVAALLERCANDVHLRDLPQVQTLARTYLGEES